MKSSLTYTKITGKALKRALIDEKGYNGENLPSENTLSNMLNRMGYNLKRVLKSKPAKKIKEVDEIFENVSKENREFDENPESLRISIDAKAKVNIGGFSRNGKSRDREAKKAEDHDMNPEMKLVPYGILIIASTIRLKDVGDEEEHWNGEILDSISKAVNWACTMTWKGIKPVVTLVEKSYEKGIRLTKKEMKPYENRIQRSNTLPK